MPKAIELRDGDSALAVVYPELGGWLTRYARNLPGKGWVEALHHEDAVVARYPQKMWAGNPVLFPHVSYNVTDGKEGEYVLNGTTYASPQHGFARRVPWSVVEQSAHQVTLELVDSELTRPSYPFAFRHRLTYRLVQGRLEWEQVVENRDQQPLPFSTGFHPYFRVPLTGTERNACRVRLPRSRRWYPVDQANALFDEPFPAQDLTVAADVSSTLFLGDLAAQQVALRDELGGVEVVLDFSGNPAYRFLILWAPDASVPFYCIEPWTALPNSFGRSDGEVITLLPGESFRAVMSADVHLLADGKR